MSNAQKPFGLRLPSDVKNWLVTRAANNERSMNAEVIKILKTMMQTEPSATSTVTTEDRGTDEARSGRDLADVDDELRRNVSL